MKKQVILFVMLASVATSAFAGLNPIIKNAKAPKATETTVKPEVKGEEEDALHCVVYSNETNRKAAECWFCNCAELYESINGSKTTTTTTTEQTNQ